MHMSRHSTAPRILFVLAAAAVLTGCNTAGRSGAAGPQSSTATLSAPPQQVAAAGTIPDYCPQVTLREGTAILRKGAGDAVNYIASIVGTSRSCRERDGEYLMEVGISGRLVPGPTAKPGNVDLPIRVAIVDSGKVVYSELGRQGVSIDSSGNPANFSYVDRNVRFPKPSGRSLTVFVGFDEGAPSTGRKPAS